MIRQMERHSRASFAAVSVRGKAAGGQHISAELCASQQTVRLLHGDPQHYNVLFDGALAMFFGVALWASVEDS